MAMVKTIVLGVALAWVAYVLLVTRYQLRHGGVVSPPLFASTMLFALGMALMLVLGASVWHLLWWFPVSTVLGVLLMAFPSWTNFNMACLGLLAGLKPMKDPFTKR